MFFYYILFLQITAISSPKCLAGKQPIYISQGVKSVPKATRSVCFSRHLPSGKHIVGEIVGRNTPKDCSNQLSECYEKKKQRHGKFGKFTAPQCCQNSICCDCFYFFQQDVRRTKQRVSILAGPKLAKEGIEKRRRAQGNTEESNWKTERFPVCLCVGAHSLRWPCFPLTPFSQGCVSCMTNIVNTYPFSDL